MKTLLALGLALAIMGIGAGGVLAASPLTRDRASLTDGPHTVPTAEIYGSSLARDRVFLGVPANEFVADTPLAIDHAALGLRPDV